MGWGEEGGQWGSTRSSYAFSLTCWNSSSPSPIPPGSWNDPLYPPSGGPPHHPTTPPCAPFSDCFKWGRPDSLTLETELNGRQFASFAGQEFQDLSKVLATVVSITDFSGVRGSVNLWGRSSKTSTRCKLRSSRPSRTFQVQIVVWSK